LCPAHHPQSYAFLLVYWRYNIKVTKTSEKKVNGISDKYNTKKNQQKKQVLYSELTVSTAQRHYVGVQRVILIVSNFIFDIGLSFIIVRGTQLSVFIRNTENVEE
jgi:hypothetical protein